MYNLVNVCKNIRGKTLLKNINLNIKEGDKIGIVGPIGSGKTSLLRVILGIYKVDTGTITYNCNEKSIGFMPSSSGLYKELTVCENIFAYTMKNVFKDKELLNLSKEIGIDSYLDKEVLNLSSGMKQKVALLIALSNNPKFVVLDEPTANLDIETRINIREFLKRYSKDKTVIITSHNLEDIEELCDRLVFVKNGELRLDSNMSKVKDDYKNIVTLIELKTNIQSEIIEKLKSRFEKIDVSKNVVKFNYEDRYLNELLKFLVQNRLEIERIYEEKNSFSHIYLELNGGIIDENSHI